MFEILGAGEKKCLLCGREKRVVQVLDQGQGEIFNLCWPHVEEKFNGMMKVANARERAAKLRLVTNSKDKGNGEPADNH